MIPTLEKTSEMLTRTQPVRPSPFLDEFQIGVTPFCLSLDLGLLEYEESLRIQSEIVGRRKINATPDYLLFVEYPHIITLGRGGNRKHLLAGPDELENLGVRFYLTGRGGDITYHGPGQLVVYPIINLKTWYKDITLYLRTLELCIIKTLSDFGIESGRLPGVTGVWVDGRKIAAIGVRTSQWVTSHGLALNVNTDLHYFDLIVPCGLSSKAVTTMAELLGEPPDLVEVRSCFSAHFSREFGRSIQVSNRDEVFGNSVISY